MAEHEQFVRVDFTRFKAFRKFSLKLRPFNILVGPNNAGKSTILAAFRILAAAMRRANQRKPERVQGPNGRVPGYSVDVSAMSIAEENIFYNYDDSNPAIVQFRISNGNELILFFPSQGGCNLIPKCDRALLTPTTFRSQFPCPIGFVPILGPVDHNERLYEKEAARLALFNYSAARNFRNIWHHYPEKFDAFRAAIIQTWPGMDIQRPEVDYGGDKPRLHMFCPEERIPREIYWSGFGFQVWCQMLTHVIQSSDKSVFLIDEPDIYLHSDLQRQLLALLRNLGPDIIIATHSTEIITEAEPDDIVVVDKRRQSAKRIRDPSQIAGVFAILGSNLNPILTQLAKTKRVLFVEGKDFQIVSRFAQKLNVASVSTRARFAVVPVEGFNPQRIRHLKEGMEKTLGGEIRAAALLDRDYRSEPERIEITESCKRFCEYVRIHSCKEIENYLLNPNALNRAAEQKLNDRSKRTGKKETYAVSAEEILIEFATNQHDYVLGQQLANRRRFERSTGSRMDEAVANELALKEFNKSWASFESKMATVPGKDALSFFNEQLQASHSVNVTKTSVINAMHVDEIPAEMRDIVDEIASFSS